MGNHLIFSQPLMIGRQPWLDMNLRTYWETKVQNNPSKIFLYHDDEQIPYSELDERINQVGKGLIDLGIVTTQVGITLMPPIR